jgi:hypothetical protein
MSRSSRRSSSRGRPLVGFLMTVVAVVAFVHYGPSLGGAIGGTVADRRVESVKKPNSAELAAWDQAADTKFVPAMHRKLPRLIDGLPDDQVVRIATHACTVLDGYAYAPHYQNTLRRDTRRALSHGKDNPTRKQVNMVIRTAGHTTCPEKNYLAAQFQ